MIPNAGLPAAREGGGMDDVTILIRVELHASGSDIRGHVGEDGRPVADFQGRLGLMTAIDRLVSDATSVRPLPP